MLCNQAKNNISVYLLILFGVTLNISIMDQDGIVGEILDQLQQFTSERRK